MAWRPKPSAWPARERRLASTWAYGRDDILSLPAAAAVGAVEGIGGNCGGGFGWRFWMKGWLGFCGNFWGSDEKQPPIRFGERVCCVFYIGEKRVAAFIKED